MEIQNNHLYLTVEQRMPDGVNFDPSKPFAGCRVCGAVFQSKLDREFKYAIGMFNAMQLRKQWSVEHAKTHTDKEHLNLARSGAWATPIAAQRLASYGVIALSDMVKFDESADALLNSVSIPVKEVEGVLRDHL